MARVCVDSNYFNVDDSGQLTIKPGSVGYWTTVNVLGPLAPINFQIADYPGAAWVFVECIGGGGAGCGVTASETSTTRGVGGGGSGGTYAASWINAATLPAVVAVSAGAGGIAGNSSGGNGVASLFGTLVIAPGGVGASFQFGTSLSNPGAPSGALGFGQIRRPGQPGGHGLINSSDEVAGGDGGSSGWPSAGGLGGLRLTAGSNAQGFGGGGGGGASAKGTVRSGGSGGNGQVLISVYR